MEYNSNDITLMNMAITLSKKSLYTTLPNPKVGAVIVKNGKIVGKGYTQAYGGKHAEAVALKQAGNLAKGGVLYCTLEPCHGNWKGKNQPPCTEQIINAGIKKVYIGCIDPNPKISGKGIVYLKKKGIEVQLLTHYEKKILELNEVFLHVIDNFNRPFMHLKIAESLDGSMTDNTDDRLIITDEKVQKEVHILRATHQAIMTGINTLLQDNPLFNLRLVTPLHKKLKAPMLIVLDSLLQITPSMNIFKEIRNNVGTMETSIVVFTSRTGYDNIKKRESLESHGVSVVKVGTVTNNGGRYLKIDEVLAYLFNNKIYSILVESGPRLGANLLNKRVIDKITTFISPNMLHNGYGIQEFLHSSILLDNPKTNTLAQSNNIKIVAYPKIRGKY